MIVPESRRLTHVKMKSGWVSSLLEGKHTLSEYKRSDFSKDGNKLATYHKEKEHKLILVTISACKNFVCNIVN